MSPEERQLLVTLFDRLRPAAAEPRDRDAEQLIATAIRELPHAPYYLAQAVILQEQAVETAAARIRELEERLRVLEARHGPDAAPQGQQAGGFLSGLGSLFGGDQTKRGYRPEPAPQPWDRSESTPQRPGDFGRGPAQAQPGPWGQPSYQGQQGQMQPAAAPWGQTQPAPQAGPWSSGFGSGSGGFLRSALGTAAGVAGGVLIADAVRDMISPHMGAAGDLAGHAAGALTGAQTPVQETIINNYYGTDGNDSGRADPVSLPDNSNADSSDMDAADMDVGGDDGFDV